MVGRLIGDHMQQKLGQPFVIENRPGASANTGTDVVAKADPDGYTVGISLGGPLAINTLLFAKMPYDPAKDIALISILTTQPSVLVVQTSLKVDSVAELLDLLRKNPGNYNYGSIGNGSLSHLAMEAIALKSGTTMVHIPYPGSPQAMTAVLRGDVQMACLPAISVTPQVGTTAFGDLLICGTGTSLDGATIRQALVTANQLLSSGPVSAILEIIGVVNQVDAAFEDGGVSSWAESHLASGSCPV